MKLHSATVIAAIVIMSLTPITKAAEAPATSDFSGGIRSATFIYSKSVLFKEFRDPGRLISANGKEYYFYYRGITYDNIKTWKEGRKLNLTYSNTKGSQLHDPISGASARVRIYGSHLIG